MSIEQASRKLGGAANVAGGVLVAIAYVLHPHHPTPEVVAGDFWLAVHVLFALSLVFGLFGLMAVFQRHFAASRWMGFAGFLLASLSLVGIFGLNYFEAFINPVLAVESPDFVTHHGAGTAIGAVEFLFPLTGLCFLLGYCMLCADLMRARSVGRGPAGLTFLGTLVFGLGLSGLFPMLVVQLGSVLFGAGLAWLGVALLGSRSARA